MRILFLVFFTSILYQSSTEKIFEGELVYHHDIKSNSIDYNYSESIKFYDTLRIHYKDKNYTKLTNKRGYQKTLFIDSLKKRFIIYRDKSFKPPNLFMNEDNLDYGKLYHGENSHFGTIISISKSDTIFNFNGKVHQLKKLYVERKKGKETYVFSETNDLKIANNRNIIRNIVEQIHPREIAAELKNSILYYYKLEPKIWDRVEEYRLVKINKMEIANETFDIPKHKDEKGFKKENRKKNRIKYYKIID